MKNKPLLLFLIVCLYLLHAAYLNTITEDAFISFRYARNLAGGHGLVWNPGHPPVEGYTNFLWVMFLSAVIRFGLPVELIAQISGVVFGLGAIWIIWKIGGVLPAFLLAVSAPFTAWASSGLETMLFTFLVTLGFFLHLREIKGSTFPFSGFVFFLSAITRPEGLLFFAFTAVHILYTNSREKLPLFSKRFWIFSAAFLLPFLLYFFWRLSYFGYLLPNTFYAKVGATHWQILRGLKYTIIFFGIIIVPLTLFIRPFFGRYSYAIRYSVLLSSCYTLYVVLVGGDYMAMFRFFVPVLPFLSLIAADTFVLLHERFAGRKAILRFAVVMVMILSVLPSIPLERYRSYLPLPQIYWNARYDSYPRLEFERWQVNRLSAIGKWMRDNLPADSSVALMGIGAIGWYSNLTIYDMSGLTETAIAHKDVRQMGQGVAGHEKEDFFYILSREPDYILGSRYFQNEIRNLDAGEVYRGKLNAYSQEEQAILLARIREEYTVRLLPCADRANGESGYIVLLQRNI